MIVSRTRKSAGDNDAIYESSYLDDDAEVYEEEQISNGNDELEDDWLDGNITEGELGHNDSHNDNGNR